MRWLVALSALVLLQGCSESVSAPDAVARRLQQRRDSTARAELAAQQPPKVVRHRLEHGELLVLDVPIVLQYGILDSAKCYIWRDYEFHSATLQCPSGLEGPVSEPAGPERER